MNLIKNVFRRFLEPFRSLNGFNTGLLLVFILINGIVLVNASLHDPRIGYDSTEHLRYIKALSEWRLVRPGDSFEFFSPPLPYLLPALLVSITGMKLFWAAKMAQLFNFLLSVGTTWYLIKICQLINPRPIFKIGTLVFLGILPVYYKTFAFVRGEPFVVFFALVMVYYFLKISVKEQFNLANGAVLGTMMGLSALSRQWGFFLFPSIFLFLIFKWLIQPKLRKPIFSILLLCSGLIILITGWFYLSLYQRYGSITAFNRDSRPQFSFDNQPRSFYRGMSQEILFDNPIRPAFPNQFVPMFYSEIWGDYWGYFSIYGLDTRIPKFLNAYEVNKALVAGIQPGWLKTNIDTFGAYLGRVNLVSIFPSLLMGLAVAHALVVIFLPRNKSPISRAQKELFSFLLLTILIVCTGYAWFLIMYPSLKTGDTIKAAYLLHVFPLIALMVGGLIDLIDQKFNNLSRGILGVLGLVYIHNFLTIITHYPLYLLH